ncbi:MAG: TRAP transporter large permease subunit [Deltaproteobacteria bacterium]|nr:TRAP transporter large permease subunit [Deltaproteobacteria bacterium]
MSELLWIFPLLLFLIFIGLPVGMCLFATAVVILFTHHFPLLPIAHTMYQTMDSFELSALPVFMLMANIMEKANVGEELFAVMNILLGRMKGGLAIATVFACGFFAAISGSSAATVITIGIVAIPLMLGRGYDRKLVFGTVGSAGLLGVLIPPSSWMIIYGGIADVSVGALFTAGVIPGIILMLIFATIAMGLSIKTNAPVGDTQTWAEKKAIIIKGIPALILPVIVLGSIYTGICTPVESASLGTAYAFLIAFRKLNRKTIWLILKSTTVMTAMLFLVIKTAVVFGSTLTLLQIPQAMAKAAVSAGFGKLGFVLLMMLIYFVLGCFVDGVCMLLLTVPIILPILKALQVDLIWYCIIMVVNMEIGCLTPPFGVNLFALMGIRKDIHVQEVLVGMIPFFIGLIVFLGIVVAFPDLSTWLPRKMGF